MSSNIIPSLPPKVLPGHLISADLMNAIIDELARLRSGINTGDGTAAVPNFFGLSIAQVRSLLAQSTTPVSLGAVIDVNGAGVDILATPNAGLIVLSQFPYAGALVTPGTPVNLVVSRSATGGSPAPLPNPTITRFESTTGAAGIAFRVGESFVVVGTNFATSASQNTVTVGTISATVISDPALPTQRLIVTVPEGISGAPTTPTGTPLLNVPVVVSLRGGPSSLPLNITVNGPSATPAPVIGTFSPSVFVDQPLTIDGTNFGPIPTRNRVYLSGTVAPGGSAGTPPLTGSILATITSATTTRLVVTTPNFGDLPLTRFSTKVSQITIQVLDTNGSISGTATSSGNVTIVRP